MGGRAEVSGHNGHKGDGLGDGNCDPYTPVGDYGGRIQNAGTSTTMPRISVKTMAFSAFSMLCPVTRQEPCRR